MFAVKSEKKNYGINFPNRIEEITPEILNEITKRVNLPKNYCVVMLCFKTRLFDFVIAMNSKKDTSVSVIPVMAKISPEDSALINSNVGDKIIIDRSCLERGVHLHLPIMISTNNARRYINSDSDLVKTITTKRAAIGSADEIIVVEFKIVPVNDITASIPVGENPTDPFLYKDESVN